VHGGENGAWAPAARLAVLGREPQRSGQLVRTRAQQHAGGLPALQRLHSDRLSRAPAVTSDCHSAAEQRNRFIPDFRSYPVTSSSCFLTRPSDASLRAPQRGKRRGCAATGRVVAGRADVEHALRAWGPGGASSPQKKRPRLRSASGLNWTRGRTARRPLYRVFCGNELY
jgi:hypothetical protein